MRARNAFGVAVLRSQKNRRVTSTRKHGRTKKIKSDKKWDGVLVLGRRRVPGRSVPIAQRRPPVAGARRPRRRCETTPSRETNRYADRVHAAMAVGTRATARWYNECTDLPLIYHYAMYVYSHALFIRLFTFSFFNFSYITEDHTIESYCTGSGLNRRAAAYLGNIFSNDYALRPVSSWKFPSPGKANPLRRRPLTGSKRCMAHRCSCSATTVRLKLVDLFENKKVDFKFKTPLNKNRKLVIRLFTNKFASSTTDEIN